MIRVVLVDVKRWCGRASRGCSRSPRTSPSFRRRATGVEALEVLATVTPDVLLVDVRMPRMSGTELIGRLASESRLPPTLVRTTFNDDDAVFEAIQGGARGFLLKDVELEQLTDAIRTIAAGGRLLQPGLSQRLVERLRRKDADPAARASTLTPRETEIVRLLAGGFSNAEVAQSLGMVEGTVKNHISSILAKLGARDRTRAVLRAIELGYI